VYGALSCELIKSGEWERINQIVRTVWPALKGKGGGGRGRGHALGEAEEGGRASRELEERGGGGGGSRSAEAEASTWGDIEEAFFNNLSLGEKLKPGAPRDLDTSRSEVPELKRMPCH
jgi:hypothetical protein